MPARLPEVSGFDHSECLAYLPERLHPVLDDLVLALELGLLLRGWGRAYLVTPGGEVGTAAVPWHFPAARAAACEPTGCVALGAGE